MLEGISLDNLIKFFLDINGQIDSQLRLAKTHGGITVVDANLYYAACHLTRTLDWSCIREMKQWKILEQAQTKIPLASLPMGYQRRGDFTQR